jgi:hypothetical protein
MKPLLIPTMTHLNWSTSISQPGIANIGSMRSTPSNYSTIGKRV